MFRTRFKNEIVAEFLPPSRPNAIVCCWLSDRFLLGTNPVLHGHLFCREAPRARKRGFALRLGLRGAVLCWCKQDWPRPAQRPFRRSANSVPKSNHVAA